MASEAYYTIITQLPHRLRVMRMYRYGLRELLSYSSNRLEWFPRAQALRLEFEANRHLTDRNEIKRCVDLGEDLLSRFKHWEPLINPAYPGGTAYSVNPSQPPGVKIQVNYDYVDPDKRGDWM